MHILAIIVFFQTILILLLHIYSQLAKDKRLESQDMEEIDIPDVILTAKDSFDLIMDCVKSIECISIGKIYLCLDNPPPHLVNKLEAVIPLNCHLIINTDIGGKINTQVKGVQASEAKTILLLDVDVRMTICDNDFRDMLRFRVDNESDFVCPFSKGLELSTSLWGTFSECDRILRQRVFRQGRDYFGLSNLSGYCLLAERIKYLDIAIDALQDDVISTINLLTKGFKVKTYPKVVCVELERNSLYKLLMQRVRWTVGNIRALPHYFSIFPHTGLVKGCIFLSTPYLWYVSAYIDFISILFCMLRFNQILCILLIIELLVKTFVIINASKGEKNIYVVIGYNVMWPLLGITALILSVPYVIFNWEEASRR